MNHENFLTVKKIHSGVELAHSLMITVIAVGMVDSGHHSESGPHRITVRPFRRRKSQDMQRLRLGGHAFSQGIKAQHRNDCPEALQILQQFG